MNLETLEKANLLKADIDACRRLLGAFEWQTIDEQTGAVERTFSRNPVLIIRCDDYDGGKEDYIIPGILQQDMIAKVKTYAQQILEEATAELESL